MGQRLVYPRDGLFLYGPVGDVAQLPSIRYGVIGTPDGVRRFREWAEMVRGFIDIPLPGGGHARSNRNMLHSPGSPKPSTPSGQQSRLASSVILIATRLIARLKLANRHEAIRSTVDLFITRLVAENNRIESPPAFWFVVIPENVYELGRPRSTIKKVDRIPGTVHVSQRRARRAGGPAHAVRTKRKKAS